MFPDRAPGVGLLLLRALSGGTLLWSGWTRWMSWQQPWPLTAALAAVAVVAGTLLLLGGLTSTACAAVLALSLLTILSLAPVSALETPAARLATGFVAVIAVALFTLGPGAYSIDARRHGRREIIIPSRRGAL